MYWDTSLEMAFETTAPLLTHAQTQGQTRKSFVGVDEEQN